MSRGRAHSRYQRVQRRVFVAAVAHVGDRDLEQLERQRRPTAITCSSARDGGEVAAGRLAPDRDPRRIDSEVVCVLDEPAQRCVAVLRRGRERELRREPVLDRGDDTAGGWQIWAHFASL